MYMYLHSFFFSDLSKVLHKFVNRKIFFQREIYHNIFFQKESQNIFDEYI